MKRTQLVVWHHVQEGLFSHEGSVSISFENLKEWVRTGKIAFHLFRYRQVTCRTYRLEVVPKVFLLSLVLRLMSRGGCAWVDQLSQKREIHFTGLARLFKEMLSAWFCRRRLLARVTKKIRELDRRAPILSRPSWGDRPVYLRTDLNFGVRSGGSIGHIAGVLNHLDSHAGPPIFLTSDRIPTVRPEIETEVIFPSARFLDFKEIPGFHYNETFMAEAARILEGKAVSFIYQRYGLNNYSGVELSQKYGVPLVLEYNGSEIWVARHWDKPLRYEGISEAVEILGLKKAALVTVVSRPLREELTGRGIEASKILINLNGVDADRYSPLVEGGGVRRKYGLDGKRVIGFIGTFGRWHGAEVLAEAFSGLMTENPGLRGDVRLFWVGDGIHLPTVKSMLRARGMGGLCAFSGLVPQSEGPAHLAACDILVSPTVPNPDGTPFFGSPTKLFEYMAMGKGIVASDLDQIGEVLAHDQTAWLVAPGEARALAAGLKTLLEDPGRRKRLGEAARREAVLKYTWKEHTGRIVEKLKERCV